MGLRGPQTRESVFEIKDKPKTSNRPSKYKKRTKKLKPQDADCISPLIPVPEDDSLMADLLWVYQQLGGRKQLLTLLQTDPKAKKDFLKTLLAHETKKLEKAGPNGGGGKGKLLILKGLYDEEVKIGDQKKFANVLDPHSQKQEAAVEAEEYIYEAVVEEDEVIEEIMI